MLMQRIATWGGHPLLGADSIGVGVGAVEIIGFGVGRARESNGGGNQDDR